MLLSSLNPNEYNVIIETGTNWGCTTIMLAQALKNSGRNGIVYSIELNPDNYKIACENVKKASVKDYVKLINDDSRKALTEILRENPHITAALLDASHNCNDVIKEFEIIHPKLQDKSIVMFDNTYNRSEENDDPAVNGALRYIKDNFEGNLINLEYVSWDTLGIAIWQKTMFK